MQTETSQPVQTVVDQLREAIRGSGESIYVVAKGAGVDASVLGRFVRNQRGISFRTAAKLCAYLGVQLTHSPVQRRARRSRRLSE